MKKIFPISWDRLLKRPLHSEVGQIALPLKQKKLINHYISDLPWRGTEESM